MTTVAGLAQVTAGVAAWFRECYHADPQGVWHAPGRANLIGEHTDYNEGWVLPFALDSGVVVAAARRDDGLLEVRSRQAPSAQVHSVAAHSVAAPGDGNSVPPPRDGHSPQAHSPQAHSRQARGAGPAPPGQTRPGGAGPGGAGPGGAGPGGAGPGGRESGHAGLSEAGPGRAGPGEAGRAVAAVASLFPGSVKGWAAYPAGVAWSLRKAGYQVGGASVAIDSNLPQGAGLSSSAALECAVALALVNLYGLTVPRQELAAITQRAENDFVGVPSGIMDQSASLLCEAGHALLLDCRTGDTESVPLDPAVSGTALLLVDTRARHTLADGSYSLRRQQCERAARALGVRSLRDIKDISKVSRLADPVLRHRARHVITENHRVLDVVRMLRTGNLAGVGPLLRSSHSSLRDDFETSWPEADVAVEAAERAGALGARMMGGGFGGSVIALVPGGGAAVCSAITEAYARHGWQAPKFLSAPPSPGAHRIR